MTLEDLAKAIEGAILVHGNRPDTQVERAFAADLLSDVLSLACNDERTTLVTGMVNPQVMRVAEILSIAAVIIVRGKVPPQSMVEYAEDLGIPLLTTRKTLFETCGLMFASGVAPCRAMSASESRSRP